MLPMPNASDLFTQQMRSRLGFGPSASGPANTHTPITPLGGMGTPGSTMIPFQPFGQQPVGANGPTDSYGHAPPLGLAPQHPGGILNTHTPVMGLPPSSAPRPNGLGAANWGQNPWTPPPPKPILNLDNLSNPTGGSPWDYGAIQNTSVYGKVDNPYGPQGASQYHSSGYLYPGGGMSYAPGAMFNPGAGMSNMMNMNAMDMAQPDGFRADPFTNMNYNAPVYGSAAPFPGV